MTAVKRLGKYSLNVIPFGSHIIETDTKTNVKIININKTNELTPGIYKL